ncbi:hypothetical protein [Streptosporangium sp. NPDC023615]|uniref:hypothetical protein n=1 Tax=Streptosporangium sp. NPDC023615 TaxID=3154794 RepID=UPI003436CE16
MSLLLIMALVALPALGTAAPPDRRVRPPTDTEPLVPGEPPPERRCRFADHADHADHADRAGRPMTDDPSG